MLIGRIRPVETRTITVHGESLAEINTLAEQQVPAGWELAAVPPVMHMGTPRVTADARIERRDGTQEIEAADMGALEAKIPDGWRLLSIRMV